jgi:hypothetical protein
MPIVLVIPPVAHIDLIVSGVAQNAIAFPGAGLNTLPPIDEAIFILKGQFAVGSMSGLLRVN